MQYCTESALRCRITSSRTTIHISSGESRTCAPMGIKLQVSTNAKKGNQVTVCHTGTRIQTKVKTRLNCWEVVAEGITKWNSEGQTVTSGSIKLFKKRNNIHLRLTPCLYAELYRQIGK
eukprot:GHVU01125980.1.p2 GENE.GHVU01125980.1~~GHVU01125980.1.p2  ORF type:complete len:119 (+),score=3.87 GHVU01125980.1:798-1154(+)